MHVTTKKLKELLVSPGHIARADFNSAAKEAKSGNIPLERLLVERGFISDANLGKAIADGFDYHFVDLKKVKISEDLLKLIPEVVARSQEVIPFELKTEGRKAEEPGEAPVLKVATTNPGNYEFIKLLERKLGYEIKPSYATPLGIADALKSYRGGVKNEMAKLVETLTAKGKALTEASDAGVVKLVNLFLEYAYENRASDIHIEPLEDDVSVRFRIDGVLHKVVEYPRSLHDKVVFRVKIMAQLRTDEHATPQDGRFDYQTDSVRFDVRVSVLPVTDGENVVLRLLSERSRRLALEDLGLSGDDLEKVRASITKPYGMVLAAGPTGSGKTTSLYALLQILNEPGVNIMTIEDPVEYDTEHVQQTQVNPRRNLTFATGLRSIVRQDPDIIMVGEMRDSETADIAVNAAMTGHLLLSTIHANDAATVFPRLIDLGVEPFLISSSVNVVIAQRLVRKICERCRMSYHLTEEELKNLEATPELMEAISRVCKREDFSKITFYKGAGCEVCGRTGYSGRTGIFEIFEVTEEIRPLITKKATADALRQKAMELGMTSMLHDGVNKAVQGVTTLEEVLRATKA